MCLQNTISTYGEETEIVTEEVTIDSSFEDITEEIQSGKEFELKFIVTLSNYSINGISGLINYDKSMLQLISTEAISLTNGEMYDDAFIFIGDNLELTEEKTVDDEGNEIVNYVDTEYVMLILTFKPLQSGNVTISADDLEYFSGMVYYTGSQGTSVDISISESKEEESENEETEKTEEKKTNVVKQMANNNNKGNNKNNNKDEDKKEEIKPEPSSSEEPKKENEESKISRIIILILILLVIAGLIYLIFKDDDDEETKNANKEIDRIKKEDDKEITRKHEEKNNSPNKSKSKRTKKKKRNELSRTTKRRNKY